MSDVTVPRSILVTGATGLVGAELLDYLRADKAATVVGVSRRREAANPRLVSWNIGAGPPPARLRRHWDVIVNAAANTRWTMSPAEAADANIASVRALRSLVAADTHVIQVSTAYAVGLEGSVESPDPAAYRNTYEWSKAGAERVARKFSRHTIVRPPLLIGRRSDGQAARFSGIYTVIRGVITSTVPIVVGDGEARLDIVPVDDFGKLLVELAMDLEAGDRAVLTIGSGPAAPTVDEALTTALQALNDWRAEHGHGALESPRVVSPESWRRFFLPFSRSLLTPRQLRILELLQSFEPYLAEPACGDPDLIVGNPLPALERSMRYWANAHPRLATLRPRPWRNAAGKASDRQGGHQCLK